MVKIIQNTKPILSLALFVWYWGAAILIWKGHRLNHDALELQSNSFTYSTVLLLGIFIALIKTKFVFIKSCHRNIHRILSLKHPHLWNFFSGKFFVALTIMILTGAYLSRIAQGNYTFLVGVSLLDYSIGFALLFSSYPYWMVLFFDKKKT
jgi:hypothetical protein